nr:DNA/RNA polymerases superfamily protein [Tanacetum cinerariifolium]
MFITSSFNRKSYHTVFTNAKAGNITQAQVNEEDTFDHNATSKGKNTIKDFDENTLFAPYTKQEWRSYQEKKINEGRKTELSFMEVYKALLSFKDKLDHVLEDTHTQLMKIILFLCIFLNLGNITQAQVNEEDTFDHNATSKANNQDRDLVLYRKKEKSLGYNNSFLGEYECSSLALDREEMRDEKEETGSLEKRSNNVIDQEI